MPTIKERFDEAWAHGATYYRAELPNAKQLLQADLDPIRADCAAVGHLIDETREQEGFKFCANCKIAIPSDVA